MSVQVYAGYPGYDVSNSDRGPSLASRSADVDRMAQRDAGFRFVATQSDHPRYELRRWPHLMAAPFLGVLTVWTMMKKTVCRMLGIAAPRVNSLFFDGLGPGTKAVKECAGQWKALDIIYNHRFYKQKFAARGSVAGWIDGFWSGMLNCQAVRNRLRLAEMEIKHAILEMATDDVRVISLAAGSAQGVIEVAKELKQRGIRVSLLLIDIEPRALAYAQNLARTNGIGDQVEVLAGDVRKSIRVIHDRRPDIVEMIGLLDYLPDLMAIRLISAIRRGLPDEGLFLTANIYKNFERHFVKWVMNWDMIYRNATSLGNILASAGFQDFRLVAEPLGIHGIAIARKSPAEMGQVR